jgi:DEAD/DEAH box helicase domain-containing protein
MSSRDCTRPRVSEYISALRNSDEFGPQVVEYRVLAATEARLVGLDQLLPELQKVLASSGISRLYSHQAEAISQVMAGHNVLLATPTASGKSLVYNLPVFSELLTNPSTRALYLFPLKALARDQLKTIEQMAEQLPAAFADMGRQPAAVYDGDTSPYMRRKIRDNLPGILITNPDMLHLSMLPYQDNWAHLFANLNHVILDEVHTYRGVFGSHISWLLRRLQRTCRLYGSDPVFILSSATIGNPAELGSQLIDARLKLLTESGAPKAVRHVLLLNPLESAAVAASKLLQAAVHRGLRTIVYSQSRKMTELITIWTERRLKEKKNCIASYRAGFLPEDRRHIEEQLADGRLLGVISTSALELGIDIGNLDICVLVGYPGSMMATWQRAGRVGRAMKESLLVMIGHEDALDQHFMRNPADFFERDIEPVVLNPFNPAIMKAHLTCMAAEAPLSRDDPSFVVDDYLPWLDQLTMSGDLLQSATGNTWFAARKYPQQQVSLRGGGIRYTILHQQGRQPLGEIDGFRALKECHKGAVYLHRAVSYLVESLDLDAHEIVVSRRSVHYFTRVSVNKETEILKTLASVDCGCTRVHFGTLRVTETITGFWKILLGSQKVIGQEPLDLPPQVFETEGLWLEIPDWIRIRSEEELEHFMGGIHALEHAIIGIMPLLVLCDRNDIGGISHPWHEQLAGAAVFIYDGHAGGVGLCKKGFSVIEQLLRQTWQVVRECPCEIGCPSCVHSPKCGSGNRPIDKKSCLHIFERLLDVDRRRAGSADTAVRRQPVLQIQAAEGQEEEPVLLPENYGVFDVETRLSAREVGGWHRADRMRVSVAVLYLGREDRFLSFEEGNIDQLLEQLFALDLVVGFNNKRFDNKVLSAYTSRPLSRLPSLDLLEEISTQLGYRLSLDRLAEHTLGIKKSGDGLQALEWFKQGKIKEITDYCTRDVQITRDLFVHAFFKRFLLFQNKAGKVVRLPLRIDRTICRIVASD